jgi:hypothetical protein
MPDILAFQLPLPLLLIPLFIIGATMVCLVAYHVFTRFDEGRRLRSDPLSVTSYHCRYCRWGVSHMEDHCVRFEGDDIVETRRFVCKRCGLPQWVVLRTPIMRKVS